MCYNYVMKRFKKIYVEITNMCNLNCPFCIRNSRKVESITIDRFNILLDKLKPYTDYLYFHVLGEPLMHNNINELIDIASNNFNINITTNGYLIDRVSDNKNIRQINISLHSYNGNKDLKEYLDNVFDSVDKLVLNKTYISLRLWVKNKYNNEIIDYINSRYKLSIPYDVKDYTINDYLFINNFHEFIWPDLDNNLNEECGTCYALIDHIGILVDGTIVPCCLDTKGIINLGNIYTDSLDDILSSKRVANMIEGFKNNKKVENLCRHCKFIDKNN